MSVHKSVNGCQSTSIVIYARLKIFRVSGLTDEWFKFLTIIVQLVFIFSYCCFEIWCLNSHLMFGKHKLHCIINWMNAGIFEINHLESPQRETHNTGTEQSCFRHIKSNFKSVDPLFFNIKYEQKCWFQYAYSIHI